MMKGEEAEGLNVLVTIVVSDDDELYEDGQISGWAKGVPEIEATVGELVKAIMPALRRQVSDAMDMTPAEVEAELQAEEEALDGE
jgi:hypothetical protein